MLHPYHPICTKGTPSPAPYRSVKVQLQCHLAKYSTCQQTAPRPPPGPGPHTPPNGCSSLCLPRRSVCSAVSLRPHRSKGPAHLHPQLLVLSSRCPHFGIPLTLQAQWQPHSSAFPSRWTWGHFFYFVSSLSSSMIPSVCGGRCRPGTLPRTSQDLIQGSPATAVSSDALFAWSHSIPFTETSALGPGASSDECETESTLGSVSVSQFIFTAHDALSAFLPATDLHRQPDVLPRQHKGKVPIITTQFQALHVLSLRLGREV